MTFRNLQIYIGIVLATVGVIGTVICTVALFNPDNTQLAVYAVPSGAPPSVQSSIIMGSMYFVVAVAGIWLIRNACGSTDSEH